MTGHVSEAIRITVIGLFINISLVLFKIAAGIFGRSSAIIADAVHSLSDLSTDLALLWGVRAADKPVDKCHDYGHGKIEALVSVGISLVLFGVGFGILWEGGLKAVKVLQGADLPAPGWIAFWAALASIITKEWLYQRTVRVGRKLQSPAVIANAWHHRSDALSSIGVMLGICGAILLGHRWHILDPLAAIIVSFFIIQAALSILYENVRELTDASLSEQIEDEILDIIRVIPGVERPHNLRTRRIGKNIAIEIHINVDPSLTIVAAHNISTAVEQKLKERFGQATFISVHVEPLAAG